MEIHRCSGASGHRKEQAAMSDAAGTFVVTFAIFVVLFLLLGWWALLIVAVILALRSGER